MIHCSRETRSVVTGSLTFLCFVTDIYTTLSRCIMAALDNGKNTVTQKLTDALTENANKNGQ